MEPAAWRRPAVTRPGGHTLPAAGRPTLRAAGWTARLGSRLGSERALCGSGRQVCAVQHKNTHAARHAPAERAQPGTSACSLAAAPCRRRWPPPPPPAAPRTPAPVPGRDGRSKAPAGAQRAGGAAAPAVEWRPAAHGQHACSGLRRLSGRAGLPCLQYACSAASLAAPHRQQCRAAAAASHPRHAAGHCNHTHLQHSVAVAGAATRAASPLPPTSTAVPAPTHLQHAVAVAGVAKVLQPKVVLIVRQVLSAGSGGGGAQGVQG